ncbi:11071_t:CDS:2, partial [Gigaspora margarita]
MDNILMIIYFNFVQESNYPQSLLIKLFDKNRTFYYKIIKEGTDPSSNQCYYTKYSKHLIPNNYIIKTQYGKAKYLTKCSIQYKNKKPQFTIQFGLNFASKVQSFKFATDVELNKIKAQTNTKRTNMNNKISKISGSLLFGLTLFSVKNIHQALPLDYNSKFYPFEDLSVSTKRCKHEILCEGAISDIKQKINLKMKKQIPLLFVNILQPIVFEESEDIPDITDKNIVTNMLESIRKGGQRCITDILDYIISFYIKKNILIPNISTLHIRISEDRRNVGRKVKHIIVTMILLNDSAGLQKPDNHYTLVLYLGSEIYELLRNALAPLILDLQLLQEN